ncbi:hypothetical protein [Streptomyces sp. NPDC000994]
MTGTATVPQPGVGGRPVDGSLPARTGSMSAARQDRFDVRRPPHTGPAGAAHRLRQLPALHELVDVLFTHAEPLGDLRAGAELIRAHAALPLPA